MKCFVMWEPWASLVFEGAKPWEFRKRDYREFSGAKEGDRVAIASGMRKIKPKEIEDLLARLDDDMNSTGLVADKAHSLLSRIRAANYVGPLGFSQGHIIGTVEMGEPRLSEDIMPGWRGKISDSDRLEHCKWAWPMIAPRRLAIPQRVRGFQGFFNVSVNEAAV